MTKSSPKTKQKNTKKIKKNHVLVQGVDKKGDTMTTDRDRGKERRNVKEEIAIIAKKRRDREKERKRRRKKKEERRNNTSR